MRHEWQPCMDAASALLRLRDDDDGDANTLVTGHWLRCEAALKIRRRTINEPRRPKPQIQMYERKAGSK